MQTQQQRQAVREHPAGMGGRYFVGLVVTLAIAVLAGAGPAEARARKGGADASDGPMYMGYTGNRWSEDFGVTRGRCDRKGIAAALADPAAAQPGGARTAILSGSDLEEDADRACAAHALELARNHRTVRWSAGGHALALSTGGDTVSNGLPCRPFVLVHRGKRTLGTACQAQPGLWEIQKG
ncbi:MAG: hypothetical protein U1F52_18975 [Burkholderiales bacterium]